MSPATWRPPPRVPPAPTRAVTFMETEINFLLTLLSDACYGRVIPPSAALTETCRHLMGRLQGGRRYEPKPGPTV